MVLVVVVVVVVVVLTQGERRGDKRKEEDGLRISYIDCSYIFSTDFSSASARRRSNSVEVNFVNINYSVQVGQCTT